MFFKNKIYYVRRIAARMLHPHALHGCTPILNSRSLHRAHGVHVHTTDTPAAQCVRCVRVRVVGLNVRVHVGWALNEHDDLEVDTPESCPSVKATC